MALFLSLASRRILAGCLGAVLAAAVTRANVTKVVIEARDSPAYGGVSFGAGGAYEIITGRVFGEIDPVDRRNAIIQDVELAPRNSRGRVEYEATFVMWKPVDMAKASGVMIYGVSNRGTRPILNTFNRGGEPGDGFVFRRGDVILTSGWQGDVAARPGAQRIVVPIARHRDGSNVTGTVLARFTDFGGPTPTLALPGNRVPANLDPSQATLTRRRSEDGVVTPIAANDWAFSNSAETAFPGVPDAARISLRGGFDPACLYELVYVAKDPLVLGVGLAATRDIVSFFHHAAKDESGAANPVAAAIRHVVAQGTSQSGNFIKTFLHLGFNEDEQGRIVWEGVNSHIAGRQNPLNFRFALPGGATSLYEPGSEGVLWWSKYEDKARGRKPAGLLDRAMATKTVPKIFETFGASEFWGLRMSPNLVGTDATRDIPLPASVRRYYFPGTTHGGGQGGFNLTPASAINAYGLAPNPNPQRETMRALLIALIDWVVKGTEPPASAFPTLARHDLVLPVAAAMGFPAIPGAPLPDHLLNPFYDYDFGPDFRANDLSGVMTRQPPIIRQVIPSLVPRVNADGNETAGVPSVLHQAPLGTYVGWSVTTNGFYQGRASGFQGAFIPFAATKAQRLQRGDPRLSLEERYGTHERYVALVTAAARDAVQRRFLLPDDAEELIRQASAGNVLRATGSGP